MKTAGQWRVHLIHTLADTRVPLDIVSTISTILSDMHHLTQHMLEDINVEYAEHAPYGLYKSVEEYVETRVKDA